MNNWKKCLTVAAGGLFAGGMTLAGAAWAQTTTPITTLANATVGPDGLGKPVVLKKQGSFSAGGVVITGTNGDTFHGDAAYVEFQIPHHARDLPLVMWHGGGQFTKTWESTPDGRDGYQQIFTRRRFSVYIIDQPRRGNAGRTTVGTTIPNAVPGEASVFSVFRLGVWTPPSGRTFFPNVQFPKDQASLDMSCSRRPTLVPKISTNRPASWKARRWWIFSRKLREAFS